MQPLEVTGLFASLGLEAQVTSLSCVPSEGKFFVGDLQRTDVVASPAFAFNSPWRLMHEGDPWGPCPAGVVAQAGLGLQGGVVSARFERLLLASRD